MTSPNMTSPIAPATTNDAPTNLATMAKLQRLEERLRELERVVIAFSGGADSAFLTFVAQRTLGRENVLAVTAMSASLAPEEADDCRSLAEEWHLNWRTVETTELEDPRYVVNDGMRCARCKTALMDALKPIEAEFGGRIVLGVNVDDLGDYRPGQNVAAENGAVFPMVDADLSKREIRELSRTLGVRTWDKPAAACLSSRVPYGTPVTIGVLSTVAKAESVLRRLGFENMRVRHYGNTARVELDLASLHRAIELRDEIVLGLHEAGYEYVTLDLEGLRPNMNRTLLNADLPVFEKRTRVGSGSELDGETH